MLGTRVVKWAARLIAIAAIGSSTVPARAQPCASWEVATPNPRTGFGAVYDSLRGRTILYGGRSEEDFLVYRYEHDTWSWDGSRWTRLAEAGPGERWSAGMAYDRSRDRVVLFGGARDTSHFGDTWEWDGSEWSLRAVTGPAARQAASIAYDEARGRTVLFGGVSSDGLLGDTWEWDGRAWVLVSAAGPTARSSATAVYHAGLQEVVIFGGSLGGLARSDECWTWNGERWWRVEGSGPSARAGAGLAYDRGRDQLVLQHGWVAASPSVRTWEWDGVAWLDTGVNGPSLNQGPLIFDEVRGRSFGFSASEVGRAFEVSAWNGAAWTLDIALAGPRDRRAHGMVFDRVRQQPLVFSGQIFGGVIFDELWARTAADSWEKLAPTGPGPRYNAGLVWDTGRAVAVLFGGSTGTMNPGGTWEWDGAWTQRAVPGPGPRSRHAMAFDSDRGVTVMFGGDVTDVNTWEWNGSSWSSRAAAGPGRRQDHAMTYDPVRRTTMLFGGYFSGALADTWLWDGAGWTAAPVAGPSARLGHSMAYDPRLGGVVLTGGADDLGSAASFGDTWLWDGAMWTELDIPGPNPRREHAMAFDEQAQRLILTGGEHQDLGSLTFGDTWELAVDDGITFTRQPGPSAVTSGQPVSLSAEVEAGGRPAYQWKRDGAALVDDGRISGATTATLSIASVQPGDAGAYTLEVSNDCGAAVSQPAALTVLCPADFTGDGVIDFTDYLEFLNAYDAQQPAADLTLDGIVDFADYLEFLNAYEAGC